VGFVRPVFGIAVAILGIGACATFSATDSQVGPPDAGPDAAVDVGIDAGSDSGNGVDSGGKCPHTFCSGFDEMPFTTGWTPRANPDDPRLILTTTSDASPSPPQSLRAHVTPIDSIYAVNQLSRTFLDPAIPKRATFAFSMRVVQPPASSDSRLQVASIGFGHLGGNPDSANEAQLFVASGNVQTRLDHDDPNNETSSMDLASVGYNQNDWAKYRITLEFVSASVVTGTFFVGDPLTLFATGSFGVLDGIDRYVDVEIGIPGAGGKFSDITVDFDDVWVDVE